MQCGNYQYQEGNLWVLRYTSVDFLEQVRIPGQGWLGWTSAWFILGVLSHTLSLQVCYPEHFLWVSKYCVLPLVFQCVCPLFSFFLEIPFINSSWTPNIFPRSTNSKKVIWRLHPTQLSTMQSITKAVSFSKQARFSPWILHVTLIADLPSSQANLYFYRLSSASTLLTHPI